VKRRLVLLLLVVAASSATAATAPAATEVRDARAAQPLAAVHTCSSRYKHAIIDGKHKCLGSGQFCAKRHEIIYRRYAFTCKAGSDSRLRLHRR
jgi:hypothetical protein